ncbi:D-serine deaminase-like pyridoxal phosphate-dependent protein [Propionicimonas paludicola]|uniref:D-serine deaminase-like pyridoxal phosphate-dependent protein n=1 Tax=Propionicimonas paludicola TaxID=185243 RepID=A0A2A9CRI8_9ACTN|nr:alanine racemase [Propionicimonas paludicola]PFG17044.1 D-serine deaminase-like pyridoxal phosphate-dependent protein [Propionicimonas paludicola]
MGQTPYLRLDVARMEANLAAAAHSCAQAGVGLRPHAKTHKCPQIAERQLAAGAVGLTVATIGEAEVFAGDGARDLFIGYPLWVDEADRSRLAALTATGVRLTIGCDSVEAGTRLAGLDVSVLVELDSGHHRSGVPAERAGELAAELSELGLDVAGAFTFPGHSYSPGAGATAAEQETAALAQARDELRSSDVETRVLSGGSTPSLAYSGTVANELRPGVYVFGDAQQVELGTIGFDQVALTVISTVVSHAGGRVICDAGSKALGADRAAWATGYGRVLDVPDARIVALSEHHTTIEWPGALPGLGSTVAIVPNHACNAVNLNEYYQLSSGGRWPVAARGRNN